MTSSYVGWLKVAVIAELPPFSATELLSVERVTVGADSASVIEMVCC
ncbi:hypothetical protein [Vibrio sp. D420a]|nr:hypothetical protein [Vibrio sp. D420a]